MAKRGTLQHHETNDYTGNAPWYMDAVIYQLDVKSFQDSNNDGVGDLRGLLSRLEYIRDLGVDCVWLQPFYVSPKRDNGYDVANYRAVDPALGTLEDFREVVGRAGELGLRVIIDLPLNHTSNQHHWYLDARQSRDSKYRPYYIWSDEVPEDAARYPIFGEAHGSNWQWDELAGQHYFHTFYEFMPDLNIGHEPLIEELLDVVRFWLAQGVSGFRMDAVPYLMHDTSTVEQFEEPHSFLRRLRATLDDMCPDGVLLGEVNKPPEKIAQYFGGGDEMHMLLNFYMCNHVFLALATGEARHVTRAWKELPEIPHGCNWANFLRNHDELALDRLSDEERQRVFDVFAPEEYMQAFGRGIRRRLAPMMQGDTAWQALAYSLLFTLPGTPVLNLGEEIGLGDDLLQPERESSRTPMQWTGEANGGFTGAPPEQQYRPVVSAGPFRYEVLNVERQQEDEGSLLNITKRMIHTYRDVPAFSRGRWTVLDAGDPGVLAYCSVMDGQVAYALHNLSDHEIEVTLDLPGGLRQVLGSAEGGVQGDRVTLEARGYRWLVGHREEA